MAYFEMIQRDRGRFEDARARMNECPLGSAALAGTGFPIDRFAIAEALGFDRPTDNSLDAVSDRDFALEYLSAATQCALHLSRLAEEMILWASAAVRVRPAVGRLVDRLVDHAAKAQSRRRRAGARPCGRIVGALVALMVTMKGLPLAYSKDMQDDKPPVFEAHDLLTLSLAAMAGMIETVEFVPERMRAAAAPGYSTATDLADWLVREAGVPFREAHHIVGGAVKAARSESATRGAAARALQAIDGRIDERVFDVLSVGASVAAAPAMAAPRPIGSTSRSRRRRKRSMSSFPGLNRADFIADNKQTKSRRFRGDDDYLLQTPRARCAIVRRRSAFRRINPAASRWS